MFWKVIFFASLWWYNEVSLTSGSQTSGGNVDCHQWVEVEGRWACGCSICTSINVLNLMRAATSSQCKEIKRGVTWTLLSSLKTSRAAAFWIICRVLILHDESPGQEVVQHAPLGRAWSFWCCAMQTCKIEQFLQCVQLEWLGRQGAQSYHWIFWLK